MNYERQLDIELLTATDLRTLVADAGQWRALQAGLAERGHDFADVAKILAAFPDFHAVARAVLADVMVEADAPDDAEMPFSGPCAALRAVPGVDVRVFAEADTLMGRVEVGYTEEGDLAFTLERGDTYLVRIGTVLNQVLAAVPGRGRADKSRELVGRQWVM